MKHPPHVEHPTTAAFIRHRWKLNFQSDSIAQDRWKDTFAEDGSATFFIDHNGNWQFQGTFPKQPSLKHENAVAEGIGLKNQLGTTIAFVAKFKVDKDGGSFSRSGHDAVVADFWKSLSKGHRWYDYGHASVLDRKHHKHYGHHEPSPGEQTVAQQPERSSSSSSGGGFMSDVGGFASTVASDAGDVVSGITSVLGDIGSIF